VKLVKLLEKSKVSIVKKWVKSFADSYAKETSTFLIKKSDEFANPVGDVVKYALNALYDDFLQDQNDIKKHLEPIIKIRAIQPFTPSKAISFIFSLKNIIRDDLQKELAKSESLQKELFFIDSKIDEMCLAAFDNYMECKDKIFQIQISEVNDKAFRALERAGLLVNKNNN